jgi:hypothetical protein
MSDLNTPDPREHPQAPAEGDDDVTAQPNDTDDAAPDEDESSSDVPPPVDPDIPGVPDSSSALGEIGPDEPGANATGVGV